MQIKNYQQVISHKEENNFANNSACVSNHFSHIGTGKTLPGDEYLNEYTPIQLRKLCDFAEFLLF